MIGFLKSVKPIKPSVLTLAFKLKIEEKAGFKETASTVLR